MGNACRAFRGSPSTGEANGKDTGDWYDGVVCTVLGEKPKL